MAIYSVQDELPGLGYLLGQGLAGGISGGLAGYRTGRGEREEREERQKKEQEKQQRSQLFSQLLGLSGKEGMPGAANILQAGVAAGLSPQELSVLQGIESSKVKQQEQTRKQERQELQDLYKRNLPVIEKAQESYSLGSRIEDIASEMNNLIKTGNVATGFKGRLLPTQAQTDETQQFEALSNELAGLLASGSGVATNFKIKLAQSMKPNIGQSQKTQQNLINKTLEAAQKLKRPYEVVNEVGEEAPNLRAMVQQQLQKKPEREQKQLGSMQSLPNPQQHRGRRLLDEDTGQVLVSDGTNWIPEGR